MSDQSLNPLRLSIAITRDRQLTPAERIALIGAVGHTDNATRKVRYSQAGIADELGISRDTVKRAFRKGLEYGYFSHKAEWRNERGHKMTNYFFAEAIPAIVEQSPKVLGSTTEPMVQPSSKVLGSTTEPMVQPVVQPRVQEKAPSTYTSTYSSTPSLIYPCFCDEYESCEQCSAPERCEDHGNIYPRSECPHCANQAVRERAEGRYSEEQRRQWYEQVNVTEGLNAHGYGD